jgi:hypothetical protein
MPYPTKNAMLFVNELCAIASRNGAEVFAGALETCAQGEDYRSVTIDVTRSDWRRLQPKLLAAGWKSFGGDTLVHPLPDGTFVISDPSF